MIKNLNKNPNIILVGNKIDLEEKREIGKEEAKSYAVQNNLHYFETSTHNNKGIHEFITYFATHLYHSRK